MVEPLEETRNELIFATEPLLSSLHLSIPGSFQYTPLVELDEVEVSLPGLCMWTHIQDSYADPEGYSTTMQRSLLHAHICASDPLEYQS